MAKMPAGPEIKKARERAGYTQQEAAELLGVTRVAWARYEADVRPLRQQEWDYWRHVAGVRRLPWRSADKRAGKRAA